MLNGMTAETAPGRVRQARPQSLRQRMVRRRIQLAVVMHILRDRRFQEKVIVVGIVVLALRGMARENRANMLTRLAAWDKRHGVSHEMTRARRALEPGKS